MGRHRGTMPSRDDYSQCMGGSLKLKGAALQTAGIEKKKKKKKKKSKTQAIEQQEDPADADEALAGAQAPEDTESNMDHLYEGLTRSERKALEHADKLEKKRIDQGIQMTHRERIDALNASLSQMAEHYDIPRVGPG